MGRPLTPPDLLMRSTAIWVPTSAVLPPAAPVPESGWSTPTWSGWPWPNASRHGAGTRIVAPRAPAVADASARNLRRVVLPLHHMSFAQGSSCHRSAIGFLLAAPRHANAFAAVTVMSGKRIDLTYTNPLGRARVHLWRRRDGPPPGKSLQLESARVRAAIEHEVLPGDVARLRAADECAHLAELGGSAEAAGRVLGLALAGDVLDRSPARLRDGRNRGAEPVGVEGPGQEV